MRQWCMSPFFVTARQILGHALPVLVAQLASIGMMVIDTVVLGHYNPVDLAAVAIGGGVHVSIVFALVGILQSVAPLAAHAHGAGKDHEAVTALQQGLWLAVLLSVPGIIFLLNPGGLLHLSPMAPAVAEKVSAYLGQLAWGLPAALGYRTFYAFCNGLGHARVLMYIGLGAMASHGILAWGFGLQGWLGVPTGALGCASSNVLISWVNCGLAALYLLSSRFGRHYRPFQQWQRPQWRQWRVMLRIGLPMGFSNLVEITAFTLIALFVAPLGADTVAGHRIVANLAALIYMVPLSLGIATLSATARALGAGDTARFREACLAGFCLAVGTATLAGVLTWANGNTIVGWYTDAAAVRQIAVALLGYLALYQGFDALQTIASHILRACRITFLPMVMQVISFWGVGLGGGWWLAYRGAEPMGVAGFWLGSVLSLVMVAGLLLYLLHRAIRDKGLAAISPRP